MTIDNSRLSSFWMPFTDNRYFKAFPRMLASADGMYYYTPEERPILDATAGLWCVNAGHRRRPIIEAVQKQVELLDFAPAFQLGHPKAFELANRLAELMPDGLDRVFFTNSGSESVDTALKIALAYQRAIGEGGRTRFIGREKGYHGTNFGGMSVGGIGPNRRIFGLQLPGVDHLPPAQGRHVRFIRGMPDADADLEAHLEQIIALHGPETIAAVIVEPVACSGGVLVPPKGYLRKLRTVTEAHGILLIFDEVITAFGRLGAATASEALGVTPDIITMAKGLTNGTIPMGAVAAKTAVYDAILASMPSGIEFFHGYTYSGHPVAAAAGVATLDIYRDEELFDRAASLNKIWEDCVHKLREKRHVTDIRNVGLVAGIDLQSRPDAPGARGYEVFRHCFDNGLLIRCSGDFLALSPPLIVNIEQIEEIVERLAGALESVS